jgi:hypothetical protein
MTRHTTDATAAANLVLANIIERMRHCRRLVSYFAK